MSQASTVSEESSTRKSTIDKLSKEADNNEVKKFIRAYELKQNALKELALIYANNALSPHFALTLKAAAALLVLPSLTNLYYAIRPHSILAGVMPFAVPLLCLTNYIYFINKDFQQFCFTEEPDAARVREQYDILYQFSYFNRQQNEFMIRLQNFRKDSSRQYGSKKEE